MVKYRSGYRIGLGRNNFRSSWEANFARLLNYLKIKWRYEPMIFILGKKLLYTPDFQLLSENPWGATWIELKGRWKSQDKKKIVRFLAKFPEYKGKFKVIAGKEYRELEKLYKHLIPEWEIYRASAKNKKRREGHQVS